MSARPPSNRPSERLEEVMSSVLPEVDERSFWFAERNKLIAWAIRRYAPQARTLLDVGCGSGIVLRHLAAEFPDVQLVGVDPLPSTVALTAERVPSARVLRGDATRLEFRGEFDVVCAFDVLEHLDDDAEAAQGLRDAAVPGGVVIVTVPQHPALWSAADETSEHRRRYTRSSLLELLRRTGLHPVRVTSFVSLLLPAMMLSRRRKAYDPVAELVAPPLLDRALRGVLTLERAAIRAGVSFPAGGSLLAVATARQPPRETYSFI